ncbi:MAG: hypothetical protein ACXW1P_05695 [Methylophilaceae bacterium]
MKYTKIALACGLALAAMSAQAAGPAIPAGTKVIFLSGATAPDNFLADIATSMMTGVTAIRSTDSLHRAFLGKAGTGIPGVLVGTDILFIKRSKGGSVWGVDPVARAQRIETIDFNNCVTTTGTFAWSCGTKGIDPGVAGHETAANTGLVADFGVSDVEPAMFQEPYNTENGQPALSPAEVARLSVKPLNQIMMGIVATNQVAETTHISRAQYGAMLAGRLDKWTQIDGSTDDVVVCRRVNGSGTQTSYNWFFTGFPCNSASSGFSDTPPLTAEDSYGFDFDHAGTTGDPFIIDPTAGLTIVENSTSSNVRACLNAAQNKTDFTVTGSNNKVYLVKFSNLPNPAKAIGVLSLDSYKNANTAGTYSFRHLDGAGKFNADTQVSSVGATGIAPSKSNLLNGKYDFVVELTMQARNATVTNPNGDVVAPITTDAVKNAFYNEFVKRAGSTKYTGNDGAPSGVEFTTVPNAYASLPQFTSYAIKPNFVSKFSRNGNTCAPLVSFPAL